MKRSLFIAYSCAFLISFAVLQLEIAMTRIYSILTWHHFTPMIISIALLGFGSAGSILTLSQKKGNSNLFQPKSIAKNAFLFSFFMLFSLLLIVRIYFEPLDLTKDPNNILSLIYHYVFMAIPFLFAGLALGSLSRYYYSHVARCACI